MKISKDKNRNLYRASVRKPDGKYRNVYGKTKKEVKEKVEALSFNIKKGKFVENNNITMKDWCKEWCENYLINVTESTAITYKGIINNRIIPYFGNQKLQSLTHHKIQVFINSLTKELSSKYIHNIFLVIHRCLKDAKNNGYISENPADNVILPKIQTKEMSVLNEKEVIEFINTAYEIEPFYADCFDFLLNTGLRVGEMIGISFDAYDPETKILTVRQQYNEKAKKFSLPKHGKIRTIVLSDRACRIIENRYERQKDFERLNENNLIFLSKNYNLIAIRTLRKSFDRICQKINKPNLRIHDLRHTYTTICLANGVDIKTLSANLGHTSPLLTLNKYSHSTINMQIESAGIIDGIFENCYNLATTV